MPNSENITSSVFLELLLAVSGETVEEKIFEKTLRLYLRKLDCFAIGIFQKESENYLVKAFLPNRFEDMSNVEAILKKSIQSDIETNKMYSENTENEYHYFFKLDNYGLLYILRRKEFSPIITKEFLPITDNLGKSLSFAKNIRLRELAEEQTAALVKDLNLFKNFIHITQDAVQVSLINGRLFYINDAAATRLGIAPEDAQNHFVWEFEPYFKTAADWESHVQQLRGVDKFSIESFNYNLKTKEKTPVEITVNIKNVDGKEFIIAVSRDISERKKAEAEVLRREKMLLAISNATNILLIGNDILEAISESLDVLGTAVGADRSYLFTNRLDPELGNLTSQRFEWNSGVAEPQIDNPELQDVPVDVFEDFLPTLQQKTPFVSLIKNLSETSELRQILASQGILSIVIIPVFRKDFFWGFVGFDACTYEREWTEAEVSILKTYVNAIQNALDREEKTELIKSMALFPILNPNPVIRTDLNGNIILENAPAENISEIEWEGKSYEKAVFLQKISSELTKENNKLHFEIFQHPASYYSVDCMLLENNAQVNFYFNNITELKENEKELKEAKFRAEASDKAKEEFIANMSHEIRTPLHAITGLSKILKKSNLNPDDQKLVGHIARSGDHLHSLINNILDFTKISAGEFQVNLTTFSFRHLIKQLDSILHNLASEKALELIFDISPNIYELLIGDETSLRQVILNLLSNSLKFTEKGSVTLTAMPVSDSENKQELEIKIIDTGIGMSDEFLNRIFDKFSQEDASLGRKYGGTGLGMAITKKLIHLMGGSIMVSSQKNEGTTFSIRLPFEKNLQKIKLGDEEKRFNNKLNSKKILIVEDNDINLLVARTVLSYHGLTIFEAKNGLEAINHPEINKVDLIFMDLQMPQMDGFAATEYLRKNLELKVPIVALTANAVKTEIDRCFELGMNDYVLKPFNEIHLLDVLSKNLNLGRQLVAAPKEQAAQDKLYDLEMLIKLSAGSNEFMIKIIGMFLDQIPDTAQEIKNAFEAADYEKTKALAHKIKATYIQFGVKKLEEDIFLLNYFDIHSKSDLEKCKTAVDNLQLITKQIQIELEKVLSSLS